MHKDKNNMKTTLALLLLIAVCHCAGCAAIGSGIGDALLDIYNEQNTPKDKNK